MTDHTEREAEAIGERAAVVVLARVEPREERRERVRVRHVELDAVEAALTSAHGGGAVGVDDRVDLLEREHVDGLAPAGARDLEEVDDLRDDLARARVVDARAEVGEARLELVRRDPEERAALRAVHGHRLDDDEPDAAAREADVPRADVVVDEPVLAGETRHHRRQDEPVRQDDVAYREGLEEHAHRHHLGWAVSAPPMMSFWISVVPS